MAPTTLNPDFETLPLDEAGAIQQRGSSPDPDGICRIDTLTHLPLSRGVLRIVISTRIESFADDFVRNGPVSSRVALLAVLRFDFPMQ
jgi:hypothetical protein